MQEAFIAELGRRYGHDVDFAIITQPRMIDASMAVARDPAHPAMRQLIEDATDPARVAALRAAFTHLRAHGENPHDHHVRAAITGETLAGCGFR